MTDVVSLALPKARSEEQWLVIRMSRVRLHCLLVGERSEGRRRLSLWLRYDALLFPNDCCLPSARHRRCGAPVLPTTLKAIRSELVNGLTGLLGSPVPVASEINRDGAVVVGTPRSSPLIAGLRWETQLAQLGPEGFRIRSVKLGAHSVTVIASDRRVGRALRSVSLPAFDANAATH